MFKLLWYFRNVLEWLTDKANAGLDWCQRCSPAFEDWMTGADLRRAMRMTKALVESLKVDLARPDSDPEQREHFQSQLRQTEDQVDCLAQNLLRWEDGVFQRH